MPSANQLDHTVINVGHDMDGAVSVFEGLGFKITPRGFHSTGSFNHLMMFGTDYLELLGLPESAEHQRPDLAGAPVGINGIVFKTTDADATFAHVQGVGQAGDPPRAFSRPVDIDGGQKDAKFRTVTIRPDVFPGGRVYFCEHGTPELVWRPEWQRQSNGVVSIPEFVVASTAPEAEAQDFADLLNGEVEDGGVAFDGGQISVLSEGAYKDRYGGLASNIGDRKSIFGALVFKTNDMPALVDILAANPGGTKSNLEDGRAIVRVTGYDAVLEFIS